MAIKISNVTVIDDSRKQTNLRLTTSVISANTAATAGTNYYINTDGVVLTLPSSPTVGDIVGVSEVSGGTTSSINRNSSNIMSTGEDLTLDQAYASFSLTYVDASIGWAFTNA